MATLIAPHFFCVFVLHITKGLYTALVPPYLFAYSLLFVGVVRRRFEVVPDSLESAGRWLFAGALINSSLHLNLPQIVYMNKPAAEPWSLSFFTFLSWAAPALILALKAGESKGPSRKQLFFGVAGVILLSKFLIAVVSPQPFIDVWYFLTQGTDALLHGQNPFTHNYPDIYHGYYDYKPVFPYFPGTFFWFLPVRLFSLDVRTTYAICEVIQAFCIYSFCQRRWPNSKANLWLLIYWVSQPVSWFVIEQSWTDTLFTTCLALLLWLDGAAKKRALFRQILLGVLIATKQYAAVMGALFLFVDWWPERSLRGLWRVGRVPLAVFAAMTLPFVLWSPGAFWASTFSFFINPPRKDALNLTSYVQNVFDFTMPGIAAPLAILILCCCGLWLMRKEKAEALKNLTTYYGFFFVSLFLCGFFVFGKQAFCNYHFMIVSALLFMALAVPTQDASTPCPGESLSSNRLQL